MENITETVYDFISESGLLRGRRLGLNSLGTEVGSCVLENAEGEPILRRYTDGTELKCAKFVFAVRGKAARSVRENTESSNACEKMRAWLEEKAYADEMPPRIFELRITKAGIVEISGTSDSRYGFEFEVWYFD